MFKKIKTALILVVALITAIGAALGLGDTAKAWPTSIQRAATSTSVSYKFNYGDSNDWIEAHIKCFDLKATYVYRQGARVGIGRWSTAQCPLGFYRVSDSRLIGG